MHLLLVPGAHVDVMEMLLLQGAQMHQAVMQQLMLSSIRPAQVGFFFWFFCKFLFLNIFRVELWSSNVTGFSRTYLHSLCNL